MHDGIHRRFSGSLIPFLTAAVLLASVPAFFREPATTFFSTVDIALHAYQLSLADSVLSEDVPFSCPGSPELPKGLLFGRHDYFPYRIHTCRDSLSDVTLARVTGDVDHFTSGPVANRSGLTATAVKTDNDLYILFGENTGSWPQRLFAHLSKDV